MDSLTIHFFLIFGGCTTISELIINEQIRDKEVRVIGEEGQQLGVMSPKDAMKLAREAEVDLVKVAHLQSHLYVSLWIMASISMNLSEKRRKLRKKTENNRSQRSSFVT